MLNITRRKGERIVVGDNIFVSVLEVSGQTVRLGIDAPRSVRVYREELWLEIKAQNEAAVRAGAIPEGTIPQLPEQPPAADPKTPPSSESGGSLSPPASQQPVNQINRPQVRREGRRP